MSEHPKHPKALSTTSTPLASPFTKSYFGGKGTEATVRTIINEIPPHTHYCEVFAGAAAIFRHKAPSTFHYLLDSSEHVVNAWKLAHPGVNIVQGDALWWLQHRAPELPATAFVLLDPPYLPEDLRDASGQLAYASVMDYGQHQRMLELASRLRCMVMVCHLPSLLYDNMLSTWRTIQYDNTTRQGIQVVQLWMNYGKPSTLHEYTYVGSSFRRRERIKRLGTALRSLSPLERKAVLAQVKQPRP